MIVFFYVGVICGVGYWIAKMFVFNYLLIHKTAPWLGKWLHRSPLAMVAFDIFFGMMGMNIFSLAGGSVVAMIGMITFSFCSFAYLGCILSMGVIAKKWQGLTTK